MEHDDDGNPIEPEHLPVRKHDVQIRVIVRVGVSKAQGQNEIRGQEVATIRASSYREAKAELIEALRAVADDLEQGHDEAP